MIEIKTLPNGVCIVSEDMPHVRSAAVGFWIGHGSRYEPPELGGISHAIEHMVFKGTKTRSAVQIASEMDGIGGQVNAYTTKESTCFYARSLDSHLHVAIDLLCDIFFEPKMDERDWETERGVIIEEIDMYEDSPEDLVSERLFGSVYPDAPLGRPILGTRETLTAMTSDNIREYKLREYRPRDIVVSLAGRFTKEDLATIEERFSTLRDEKKPERTPCSYVPGFSIKEKAIEQNHLCLGFPGISNVSGDRYTQSIMSGILGAGMSSRLFQTVREQNGLCYSIYSFTANHNDTGVFGVYSALGKNTEMQALRLARQEITRFAESGPEPAELDRAREQIKANVLMSLESTSARMMHLGQNQLLLGKIPQPDDIIARLDDVSRDKVTELARRVFDFSRVSFSAVGQVAPEESYREVIGIG